MLKDPKFWALIVGIALAVDIFGGPVRSRVAGFLGRS